MGGGTVVAAAEVSALRVQVHALKSEVARLKQAEAAGRLKQSATPASQARARDAGRAQPSPKALDKTGHKTSATGQEATERTQAATIAQATGAQASGAPPGGHGQRLASLERQVERFAAAQSGSVCEHSLQLQILRAELSRVEADAKAEAAAVTQYVAEVTEVEAQEAEAEAAALMSGGALVERGRWASLQSELHTLHAVACCYLLLHVHAATSVHMPSQVGVAAERAAAGACANAALPRAAREPLPRAGGTYLVA